MLEGGKWKETMRGRGLVENMMWFMHVPLFFFHLFSFFLSSLQGFRCTDDGLTIMLFMSHVSACEWMD